MLSEGKADVRDYIGSSSPPPGIGAGGRHETGAATKQHIVPGADRLAKPLRQWLHRRGAQRNYWGYARDGTTLSQRALIKNSHIQHPPGTGLPSLPLTTAPRHSCSDARSAELSRRQPDQALLMFRQSAVVL